MTGAAVISGTVRNQSGTPVQEARVFFTAGPVPLPDIAALTDEQGAFSLVAPTAGTYRIACIADGFAPAEVEISVGGAPVPRVTVTLTRPT